ncbi:MAG TPA: hypothetical protein VMH90_02905, partial [Thermoplasmata archaeon]|nr:hypothetical protein [Thermoplasmata archaeon]
MELLELFLLGYSALVLFVQGIAIYLAYATVRIEPGARPPPGAPPVAVVIAARNEAEAIGGCLE